MIVCVQPAPLRRMRERQARFEAGPERRGASSICPQTPCSQPRSLTRYNRAGAHALATKLNLTVRDRHSLAIAGIACVEESPLLCTVTMLCLRDLNERVRPQKLSLALGGLHDPSAGPRCRRERHDRAMLRGAHGPAVVADYAQRADGTDTAANRLCRRRMRDQQRSGFCPVILPPAPYALRLEPRQGEARESRERADATAITAKLPSNGGLTP